MVLSTSMTYRLQRQRLQRLGYILLIGASSTLALSACEDRTKPDSEVIATQVPLEPTKPLVAGQSVGSANIEDVPADVSPSVDIATSATTSVAKPAASHATAAAAPSSAQATPSIVTSQLAPIQDGSPEAALAKAVNTLYYGDARAAAAYYETSIPNFAEELAKTQQGFRQNVKSIRITAVTYNEDKTRAVIKGNIALLGNQPPGKAEFSLRKVDGAWKILG